MGGGSGQSPGCPFPEEARLSCGLHPVGSRLRRLPHSQASPPPVSCYCWSPVLVPAAFEAPPAPGVRGSRASVHQAFPTLSAASSLLPPAPRLPVFLVPKRMESRRRGGPLCLPMGRASAFPFGAKDTSLLGSPAQAPLRERAPGLPAPGKLGGKEVDEPGAVTGGPPHPLVPGRRPPGQPGCQLSWGLGTRRGGTPGRLNRKFPRICTHTHTPFPGKASGKIQARAGEREGVPGVPGAGCGAPPWLCVGCKVL